MPKTNQIYKQLYNPTQLIQDWTKMVLRMWYTRRAAAATAALQQGRCSLTLTDKVNYRKRHLYKHHHTLTPTLTHLDSLRNHTEIDSFDNISISKRFYNTEACNSIVGDVGAAMVSNQNKGKATSACDKNIANPYVRVRYAPSPTGKVS